MDGWVGGWDVTPTFGVLREAEGERVLGVGCRVGLWTSWHAPSEIPNEE